MSAEVVSIPSKRAQTNQSHASHATKTGKAKSKKQKAKKLFLVPQLTIFIDYIQYN